MTDKPKPIPAFLGKRYKGWRATAFVENETWFRKLAAEGQSPRTMVIACCDSRVHVTSIFGAETGEFFIHRNIANLVPPFSPDGDFHGTSAAIEYAVKALRVSHIMVIGHSRCGGVEACYHSCASGEPPAQGNLQFVDRWLDILRPRFSNLPEGEEAARLSAFEHEAVLASLDNLMTFPFIKDAVEAGKLLLHGAWIDIGDGTLLTYDGAKDTFEPVV